MATLSNVDEPHKCDKCTESFEDLDALQKHKNKHAVVKDGTCRFCGKVFSCFENLKQHTRGKAVHFYRLWRDICSCSLKIHMVLHTAIYQHKCHICRKTFAQNRSLVNHIQIHSGIEKYECELCDRSYYSIIRQVISRNTFGCTPEKICIRLQHSPRPLAASYLEPHGGASVQVHHVHQDVHAKDRTASAHTDTHLGAAVQLLHLRQEVQHCQRRQEARHHPHQGEELQVHILRKDFIKRDICIKTQ